MSEVNRFQHIGKLCRSTEQLMQLYPMATQYVLASDYDRLEAENKELKAELEVELQRRWNGNEASSREHAEELKALRARAVVVVPERDSGGSYYEEGWNACLDELARLNDKTISEGLLRKWLELMEHGDFREGHCMCGSAVNAHGIGDGHAPVDAGEYYAGQVMEELRAMLDAGDRKQESEE